MAKVKTTFTAELAALFPSLVEEGISVGSEVVFEVYSYIPGSDESDGLDESDSDEFSTQGDAPDDGGVVGGGERPPKGPK